MSFDILLDGLRKQHATEIDAAVKQLRAENQRLKEELVELRGQLSLSDPLRPPLPPLPYHLGRSEELAHNSAWATSGLNTLEPPILLEDVDGSKEGSSDTVDTLQFKESRVELKRRSEEKERQNLERRAPSHSLTQIRDDVLNLVTVNGTGSENTQRRRSILSGPVGGVDRMLFLNVTVGIVIIISLLTTGFSMDVAPRWGGWAVIEFMYGLVFLLEILAKCRWYGCRVYFLGPQRYMNWLDAMITAITLLDASATILLSDDSLVLAKKVVVGLRAVRMLRIIPLLKLVDVPMLARLASMFTGLAIGMPWLIWVAVILCIFTYMFGMIFRQLLGPSIDQDFRTVCGDADVAFATIVENGDDPYSGECRIHYLYGEEYFGTVADSMFTIFRCMLGDCSSKGGQALAPHFGFGYGLPFYISYSAGMIIIIFGLFNVITAIFVESTMEGLKYNDAQKTYARKYRAHYVRGKVDELVRRLDTILPVYSIEEERHDRKFSREEFAALIRDEVVISILQDLDVSMDTRQESILFDGFDTDNDGVVTLSEFLETLMRMRGEPTKCDMIASWALLRKMSLKMRDLEDCMVRNHAELAKTVHSLE